jgi:GT2 family glycosyltransferase
VYVHAAPDEPEDRQSRVIRVPGGQDKHVNIIFVKTPSSSSNQQTEVILPQQNEQKTLVYVLLKKGESNADVRVRAPAQRAPSKPEVFFIRYKNAGGGAGGVGGGFGSGSGSGVSSAYGAPAPAPSTQYGV